MWLDRLKVFCTFVDNLRHLSKCEERKVAAIITDVNLSQIYSIGINGGPRRLQDCLCIVEGKYGCLHAEQNALIKCTNTGPKSMIVSLAPCKQCAAAIINSPGGFYTVYYLEQWKDDTGIKMLKTAGIHVHHVKLEEGF